MQSHKQPESVPIQKSVTCQRILEEKSNGYLSLFVHSQLNKRSVSLIASLSVASLVLLAIESDRGFTHRDVLKLLNSERSPTIQYNLKRIANK